MIENAGKTEEKRHYDLVEINLGSSSIKSPANHIISKYYRKHEKIT